MANAGERRWRKGSRPDYTVNAVDVAARVLRLLIAHPDGLSLDQLTRMISDASKTTVYRDLDTFVMNGLVDRVSPKLYRPGPGLLLPMATHIDVLVNRARPHLAALSEKLRYTVSLGMLDGSAVTVLEVVYGGSALQVPGERGARLPLHASALGKVLAATLEDDEVCPIVRITGMPARTPYTVTDPDALVEELGRIRRRGWAVDDREYDEGLRGVAVALPGRRVVVGLALTGPAEGLPLEEMERTAALLCEHADRVVPSPERDAS